MKKRISYLSLYGANALIYGLNALYYGFLPIFLENRGRSNDEIGYLLAAAQLVSVFAPFFWGMITDKAKYKNNILAFLILCAGVSFTSIILCNSLIYLFVMIPLVMFFQNNFGGLIDTVT
ncbi:MAG: MFS transporter, partial [Clostridia bacterium]|nr:MFS transporter [Clostridia bacterium]